VSINLDTGPAEVAGQDDSDPVKVAGNGQLSLQGIDIPQARPATKTPNSITRRNVNDRGGG
jgi:hypothetical protein